MKHDSIWMTANIAYLRLLGGLSNTWQWDLANEEVATVKVRSEASMV